MSFTRYRAFRNVRRTQRDIAPWTPSSLAFAVAAILSTAPLLTARAAGGDPTQSSITAHAHAAGEAIRQDSKALGAAFKEGAHRVAVAAKAVGHEVATAARRGTEKTRAAFRGED